jgi:hypothetical protein
MKVLYIFPTVTTNMDTVYILLCVSVTYKINIQLVKHAEKEYKNTSYIGLNIHCRLGSVKLF